MNAVRDGRVSRAPCHDRAVRPLVIAHRTGVYLDAVRAGVRLAMRPPSQGVTMATNRSAIATYESAYNRVVLGAFSDDPDTESPTLFAIAFGVLGSLVALYRIVCNRHEARWRVLAFVRATAVFSTTVTNRMEYGENDCFRVEVEALFGIVGVLGELAISSPTPKTPWGGNSGPPEGAPTEAGASGAGGNAGEGSWRLIYFYTDHGLGLCVLTLRTGAHDDPLVRQTARLPGHPRGQGSHPRGLASQTL